MTAQSVEVGRSGGRKWGREVGDRERDHQDDGEKSLSAAFDWAFDRLFSRIQLTNEQFVYVLLSVVSYRRPTPSCGCKKFQGFPINCNRTGQRLGCTRAKQPADQIPHTALESEREWRPALS
ncbi:MAG: hypothetical protein ACLRZG_05660 [Streptococcus sp.]